MLWHMGYYDLGPPSCHRLVKAHLVRRESEDSYENNSERKMESGIATTRYIYKSRNTIAQWVSEGEVAGGFQYI